MRNPWIVPLLTLFALAACVEPAMAQPVAATPYNFSWASLSPGNDWAAQVVQSIFPVTGTTASPGTSPGQETTVIQLIVGQFTGFVGALACAFVSYTVIMNIHRAAESSRILGQGQSWMFVVRVGFAGVMMFPLGGGFSAGQALVMQAALTGIGMARAVYTNAITAVGPDAAVIATPMIPGTQQIVAGMINNELCMDLVNLAGNSSAQPLVPNPKAMTVQDPVGGGGFTSYRYSFTSGNEFADPVCGTVGVRTTATNQATVAGYKVDMAAVQQALMTNVLGYIHPLVQGVATNLWQTKNGASLAPLQDIYTTGVQMYTAGLTASAQTVAQGLNAAARAQATQIRNGASDLLQNEVQQSTLGWTGAGAYYLEIAKLNASTLSLMAATPVTTAPTYNGLGQALSYDLAGPEAAANEFMTTLNYVVQTQDGTQTPNGVPHTLSDAKGQSAGGSLLEQVFGQLNWNQALFKTITGFLMPTTTIWTDPFGGLMALGQTLINTALAGLGTAAVLSSATLSTGAAIWDALTFNWGAAAATVAGHAVMNFLGTPIFMGLLALLVPGLMIAYVLPMVPYVMWMAGVAGWIILVCEAMIAVPLWMLAHMTVGGDGLHGRAIEGWGLLFNVVFRPTLMLIGLFLGYFVFDCMSWLIRETFGIAVGFVLANGWIVTNFIGLGVLLSVFVMIHVVAALMSFRMVALLPHHLPRLIGFTSANRVDADDFMQRAAWLPTGAVALGTQRGMQSGARAFQKSIGQMKQLPRGTSGLIAGAAAAEAGGGMDSTLRATTADDSEKGGDEDV